MNYRALENQYRASLNAKPNRKALRQLLRLFREHLDNLDGRQKPLLSPALGRRKVVKALKQHLAKSSTHV